MEPEELLSAGVSLDDALYQAQVEGRPAGRRIVFCVGNVLRGDDAAGPLLAKMLTDHPVEGWDVIDGGQTPEDDLAVIRRTRPERVIVVDAAAMGLPVGTRCLIEDADVKQSYLMSTHALPITLLLSEIRSACDDVSFVGIQPGSTEFFDPLTPAVHDAVQAVYDCIAGGADLSDLPHVSEVRERLGL